MKPVSLPHMHDLSCNAVSCSMFMKHGCMQHSFRETKLQQ
jgi:hypothetical protein